MYLNMLWTSILPAIHQFCKHEPLYFQQYKAPPYYHQDIRSYLNETLPGQWIGGRGSVKYHSCLPDLTPLDFYLWRSLKDVVYCKKPPTLQMLREEIEMSCAAILVDTLATAAHALVC
jgi:hypothetical protein